MKKVFEELRYDGATLDEVYEMLATPAFREEVCDSQSVLRHSVEINRDGKGMTVEIDQVQAAEGLPGFVTKIVGDEINIVQVEDWSALDAAALTVSIPGKPAEMSGTITLRESATTTEDVALDIRVGIPLVGGKIEQLVGDLLVAALKIENRVGRDYLSR